MQMSWFFITERFRDQIPKPSKRPLQVFSRVSSIFLIVALFYNTTNVSSFNLAIVLCGLQKFKATSESSARKG